MKFRNATLHDAKLIFEWQSHPETRKHFFDPHPPTWEKHYSWLECCIQNKKCELLVAEENGALAIVKFDLDSKNSEISIYLSPEKRGRNLGAQVLLDSCAWIAEKYPLLNNITAKILDSNIASQKIFERAGFKKKYTEYNINLK